MNIDYIDGRNGLSRIKVSREFKCPDFRFDICRGGKKVAAVGVSQNLLVLELLPPWVQSYKRQPGWGTQRDFMVRRAVRKMLYSVSLDIVATYGEELDLLSLARTAFPIAGANKEGVKAFKLAVRRSFRRKEKISEGLDYLVRILESEES